MIKSRKYLSLPVLYSVEEISFEDLREIQRRFLRGGLTEEDKKWIDAILSAIQTGRLE